jgi:type I restriction enzyme S subunit
MAGPLLKRIAASDRESRTLAHSRDALLPKLISGDLRIADVDRVLGGGA